MNTDTDIGINDDVAAAFIPFKIPHQPLRQKMIASGHEHSIQILEHELPDAQKVLQVVSGSGSIDEHTPVGKGKNTLMATPHAGFVVVDVLNSAGDPDSSGVLISVIEVETSEQVDPQNSSAVHSKDVFRMSIPKR